MIQSVRHAWTLLACFEREPSLGLSELARALDMPKSTVHNLVKTLVHEGVLRQNEAGQYQLGIRLLTLGNLVLERLEIAEVAIPILKRVERQVRETVHLAVLEGTMVVYTVKIESDRSVRMSSRIGRRAALYCTGAGKLLLAHHPELLASVMSEGLEARTPRTMTDPADLAHEMDRIVHQGYAVDNEETEESVLAVAVPVRDWRAQVIAAITVAGPSTRLRALSLPHVIEVLRQAGHQLSRDMGAPAD